MIKPDAYVSPTQRKKALKAAGYRTGVTKLPEKARCDTCSNVGKSQNHMAATTYDRHCGLFDTGVKTHGICDRHSPAVTIGKKALKSFSGNIRLSTKDGFGSAVAFSGRRFKSPDACLLALIDELARVAELYGLGDQATTAVETARNRTAADLRAKGFRA